VVLLHGFPEFWYSWHRQIEPLSAAGFRVIVPDQRGYNLSSKPVGVCSYAMPELVSDVIAIADQLGQRKIFLAGHDWGAAVARGTPRPGALHAMINRYRALFRTRIKFQNKPVRVATRILWGERDDFLLTEMAHESLRYCTSAELFTFASATHWLQHEEPARVSEILADFFRA